ncbi:hypothetical protein [Kribbella sp. CA-294648]|uniref:hypothetical protein n=1 Tax=Kribbella sp. CA-294648 TaxID=3239948 RepID=UPI003D8C3BD5
MAARDLVFEVGDRVRAGGQYIAGPDGDWLDLARVHDLIAKPPGWKSDRSIRLIGADVGAIPNADAPSLVPPYVWVVGPWRDGSIEVEEQSTNIPVRERRADWTDPPCPSPPGGWRHKALAFDLDYGGLDSSGVVVTRTIFRPSADQEVLVIAATDIDAVTQQMSPQLPNQFCVVPSRFTRAQLDEVRDVLLAHWREWRLESCGNGVDPQAQPFAMAQPFRVTPDLAEWADTLPAGLLRLNPAIEPA